jgi:hypothetical protein
MSHRKNVGVGSPKLSESESEKDEELKAAIICIYSTLKVVVWGSPIRS